MSRRTSIILAYALALVATWEAWTHAMRWKDPPPVQLAIWLPLEVVTDAGDPLIEILFLVQFPALATLYVLGAKRWRAWRVAAGVIVLYAVLVAIALYMVKHNVRWGGR
jgi:hypothetical protein